VLVKSDAAGEDGWGYYIMGLPGSQDAWGQGEWLPHELAWSILAKELKPVVVCAREHGHKWKGKMVSFGVDNAGLALCLNAGRARDAAARGLMRELADLMIKYDFEIVGRWVPRLHNVIADLLSRQISLADARVMAAEMEANGAASLPPPADCSPQARELTHSPRQRTMGSDYHKCGHS
jgi:hypothetical protein